MNYIKKAYRKYYQKNPIIFFRKFFNTFLPFITFVNKKTIRTKDSIDWMNSTHNRSHFNYETIKQHEYLLINEIVENIGKDEKILDICCNQGRFIYELKKIGYRSLYGFDIMEKAIKCLKLNKHFDQNIINVELSLAQNYFNDKPNNFFDWAITYSATIELIHPEFDIFNTLFKKIKKGLILVINEREHTYPRFYRYLINRNGFKILKIQPIFRNNNFINLFLCIK